MNWARRLEITGRRSTEPREQRPVPLKTICIQAAVCDRELKRFLAMRSSFS